MPGVAQIRESVAPSSTPIQPECEELYLPSTIDVTQRTSCCTPGLPAMECRIRLGQADDALNEVRRQLRITSSVIQFKRGQHQASQQLSRKTKALMTQFTTKTQRAANRYITAFTALSRLDPGGEWSQRLQPLDRNEDLQLPRPEEDDKERRKKRGKGENQRELSWIWRVQGLGGRPRSVATADEVNDSEFVFF